MQDAWQQFLGFYGKLIENYSGAIVFCFLAGLVVVLIGAALRRGARGALQVIAVFAMFILSGNFPTKTFPFFVRLPSRSI